MGLRWRAASSLPGLVLGYRPDGLQVGRVRDATYGAAWEGHYDPAGLERPAGLALRGQSVDDEPFLVARGVRLWEAKQAVERCHELLTEAAELAGRQADAAPPPDPRARRRRTCPWGGNRFNSGSRSPPGASTRSA